MHDCIHLHRGAFLLASSIAGPQSMLVRSPCVICLPVCPATPPSQAGLLAPSGPLALLDLFLLTQQCGEECSTDGVHSVPDVYDAALQLLLNLAAAARTGGGSSPIVGGQPGPARRRLRDRGHALPWRRVARP